MCMVSIEVSRLPLMLISVLTLINFLGREGLAQILFSELITIVALSGIDSNSCVVSGLKIYVTVN